MAILRYLLSGGSAAALNLVILYVLTDVFGVWYLFSSSVAFIASLAANYALQKYWTFRNCARADTQRQIIVYVVLCLANVLLNGGAMRFLVEKMKVWYVLAQALTIGGTGLRELYNIQEIHFLNGDTRWQAGF